ncbi:restriction endonuclease subunit S [Ornithobacterium rhinotracheale]
MKQTVDYKYLNFTQLSAIDSWSTYAILGKRLMYTNKYPFVEIGKFLKRNKTQVKIQNGVIYKRPTIKMNAKGITLRDEVDGINIGTKNQFRIKEGQFLLSKIDARNGAFGVVPKELDNGIITGNFWTFDVDYSKINPVYLTLLTGTKEFQKLSQSASVGTTNRNYLQEKLFLDFKIPLPSLAEQEAIVKAYQTKIQQAQNLEQQAQNLEQEIEKYLDDILGIKINNKKKITKGLQKVDYKLIDKWTLDDIFNKNIIQSEKYRLVKISELCSLITDGTHQTPKYFNEGVVFLSAKNVTQQTIDWDNIKYVSKEAHNEYCKRVKPEVNDILLAKNGTTGVAALVDREMEFSIYVSLALLKPIKDKVLPEFLLNLINSNFVKTQFNSRLIGIGVPNLHLGEIRNTLVPLPTMNIQIEITKQISIYKSNINNIKSKVETLKHQAEQEFEQAIFN